MLLDLVDLCDNFKFQLHDGPSLVPFCLNVQPPRSILGLLKPAVLAALQQDNARRAAAGQPVVWDMSALHNTKPAVGFSDHVNTRDQRSQAIMETGLYWREAGLFPEQIGGRLWRDELYTIYLRPFAPLIANNVAFAVERVLCALFGLVTYGVHATVYTPDFRIWIAQRSTTKQTWPGFLDNSAAGGIGNGMQPLEAIIKEAREEASLDDAAVRPKIKSAGAISYFNQTPAAWLQPEVQFVFDLCVSPDVVLKPCDGEVACFELCTVDEVLDKMHRKLFKPNCALVLIDFLIRHGHVTSANEPHYLDILTRLHGRFGWDQIE